MNLNRIGIVIYRAALVGSILFISITLRQLGSRRLPINVSASISGDVAVSSSSALAVNVNELPNLDFAQNAFLGAGTLDVSTDSLDVRVSDLPPLDFETGASLTVEHLP